MTRERKEEEEEREKTHTARARSAQAQFTKQEVLPKYRLALGSCRKPGFQCFGAIRKRAASISR